MSRPGCFLEANRFATIFSVALSSVSVLVVVVAVEAGAIRRSSVVILMVVCGRLVIATVAAEEWSCCCCCCPEAVAATSTHGAGDWGSREATDTTGLNAWCAAWDTTLTAGQLSSSSSSAAAVVDVPLELQCEI